MTQTESRALERRTERAGQLATGSPPNPIDGFQFLDVYAGGLVEQDARIEALATISAGYRGQSGAPQRSTDGTIYLHDAGDRAPGLARALEKTNGKSLTIAFPFDDPAQFIHSSFRRYSQTALEAFGDHTHLMVQGPKGYVRVEAGTPEYEQWVATCKANVSVYFCLAEWTQAGPRIVFPDGVGAYYRLRFTSRHSIRSIVAGLKSVAAFTQGRIAGVPFELSIDTREVADPTGKKRRVPVWTVAMKPPVELQLSSGNFSDLMGMALAQGAALMIAPPEPPTLDSALLEEPDDDLDERTVEGVARPVTDDDLDVMERGGRCDARHYNNQWHMTVRGSRYADEATRAAFIREFSKGATSSLSDFLEHATDKEALALVVAVDAQIRREQSDRTAPPVARTPEPSKGRSYRELFPDDEEDAPKPAAPARQSLLPTEGQVGQVVASVGVLPRPEEGKAYTRRQWAAMYIPWAARLKQLIPDAVTHADTSPLTNEQLRDAVLDVIARADEAAEFLEEPPVFPDDAEMEAL